MITFLTILNIFSLGKKQIEEIEKTRTDKAILDNIISIKKDQDKYDATPTATKRKWLLSKRSK